MKTKIILLALAAILAFTGNVMARLNESKEQCVKRYGESADFRTATFCPVLQVRYHYYYLNIYAGFNHGVASIIRYSKRVEITAPELRLILDAEGGIENWHEVGKRLFLGGVEWRRSDGATAILYKNVVLLKASNQANNPPDRQTADVRSRFWEKGYPVL